MNVILRKLLVPVLAMTCAMSASAIVISGDLGYTDIGGGVLVRGDAAYQQSSYAQEIAITDIGSGQSGSTVNGSAITLSQLPYLEYNGDLFFHLTFDLQEPAAAAQYPFSFTSIRLGAVYADTSTTNIVWTFNGPPLQMNISGYQLTDTPSANGSDAIFLIPVDFFDPYTYKGSDTFFMDWTSTDESGGQDEFNSVTPEAILSVEGFTAGFVDPNTTIKTTILQPPSSSVPEPATWWSGLLLGSALWVRRRRKKSA